MKYLISACVGLLLVLLAAGVSILVAHFDLGLGAFMFPHFLAGVIWERINRKLGL